MRMTMRHSITCLLFLIASCGKGVHSNPGVPPDAQPEAPPPDSHPDEPPPPDAESPESPETHPLGMNDITILIPLPLTQQVPLVGTMNSLEKIDGSHVPLVPQAAFTRLVTAHHDIMYDYVNFHVFAIRFDLC